MMMKKASLLLALLLTLAMLAACGAPSTSVPAGTTAAAATTAQAAGATGGASAGDAGDEDAEDDLDEAEADGAGAQEQTQAQGQTQAAAQTTAAATEPPSDDPSTWPTLTYWAEFESNAQKSVSTYSDLPLYQELMKMIGINIVFQHPPVGAASEQFKLLVASKNLPDIIEYDWLNQYPQGPEKAIADQVIIPLNDHLFTDKTPYLSALLRDKPDVNKDIQTYAGNYYVFPALRADDLMEQKGGGPTIRGDALDKAGLEPPKTIAEWETMLVAFKEMGFDYPFTASGFIGSICNGDMLFLGAYGVGYNYYPVDGKVYFGQIEPQFKDYLALLRRWYDMGLIDPDIITNSSSDLDAIMTSGRSAATDRSPDSGIGVWTTSMQKTDPEVYFIASPFPVLNEGDTRYFAIPNRRYAGSFSAAITTECKDIDTALRLLDWGYSDEAELFYNFGVEGISFEYIDGEPEFTDLIKFNPDGLNLKEAMILWGRNTNGGPFQKGAGAINSQRTFDEQREAPYIWANSLNYDRLLPVLAYTPEEAAEYADIMNEINVISEEMCVKVMIGDREVDDFDSYVNSMKNANIERGIEIVQAAYERYLSH
ncbi:MAG: ABC transporter substrate-binding protein [Oscillospiraceae bacterium]|nr:ABC transporter substrate-binding protein [Oscillospiraceae bacterium]